jgi:hypothetical protein
MSLPGGISAMMAGALLFVLGVADPPGRLGLYVAMAALTLVALVGLIRHIPPGLIARAGLLLALAGAVSLTVGQVAILWSSSFGSFRENLTHPLALSLQSVGFLLSAVGLRPNREFRMIVPAMVAIGVLSLATLATYAWPTLNLVLRSALAVGWLWLGLGLWQSARLTPAASIR